MLYFALFRSSSFNCSTLYSSLKIKTEKIKGAAWTIFFIFLIMFFKTLLSRKSKCVKG